MDPSPDDILTQCKDRLFEVVQGFTKFLLQIQSSMKIIEQVLSQKHQGSDQFEEWRSIRKVRRHIHKGSTTNTYLQGFDRAVADIHKNLRSNKARVEGKHCFSATKSSNRSTLQQTLY